MGKEFLDKILEAVVYFSIAVLVAWIILKILGVIRSPVWIEMIPYLSIAFGFGAGFTKIKNLLDEIFRTVKELAKEQKDFGKRLILLETEHILGG